MNVHPTERALDASAPDRGVGETRGNRVRRSEKTRRTVVGNSVDTGHSSASSAATGWVPQRYSFVATGASTTLSIISTTGSAMGRS